MPLQSYIALKSLCEEQMQLEVCDGCDACGLRCASGVPATRAEWEGLEDHLDSLPSSERNAIALVEAQDKTVDLGDGVTVQMCRYRDMEAERCVVYAARPLICRLLGHVEWLPCPIEKVVRPIPTPDALTLMRSYALFERKTFEQWESDGAEQDLSPLNGG